MSFVKYGTIIGFSQVTETPITLGGYGITDAVPNSRTLTINGTTFDLSANRTWTISTGISGSGTTNYIPKWTTSSALGNSLMQEGTNAIGLGVTPSASWFTGSKVIQIGNTAALWNNGSNNSAFSHNAIFGDTTTNYIQSSGASYYRQIGGEHNWFNAPSGTAGNAITFTQAMTLTSAGRLLINQTSDSGEQLQVNGSVRVAGVGNSIAFDTTGANATSVIKTILDYELSIQNNRGTGSEIIVGNEVLSFKTNATQRLSIASTGAATFSSSVTATELFLSTSNSNVGNINSTNANGGYLTWQTSGTTIADIGTAQQIFGSGGNDTFGINARGARSLVFGTNNTSRFSIASTGAATFSSSVTATQIYSKSDSTEQIVISTITDANKQLIFGRTTTDARITAITQGVGYVPLILQPSSGNVLIGTTTDDTANKLQVNGNSNINGTIIGTDQTFGGAYRTFAFGVNSNNYNRIFATTDATDGIYINAATGQGVNFRVNGGGSNVLSIASTGAATFSQSLGIGGVADSVKGLTYSPTLTDITNINISSTSGATFTYIRVGYIVTVNGFVNVAPNTVGTLFQLNISLPIASAFISTSDATGVATSLGFGYGYLIGDATADTVQLNATSTTLSSKPFHVQFSYFLR